MTLPLALALGSLVASPPASLGTAVETTGADAPIRAPFPLRYEPFGDPAIAAFASAAWETTELVSKDVLAPSACRWCDRTPDGIDRLNALDRWGRGARWDSIEAQHTAGTLSNVVGFGALPAAIAGIDVALAGAAGARHLATEDLVLVWQSMALAMLLNQSVKFIAARERPFVHVLPPEERQATADPLDNNLSFFSGHATFAFSAAVAAGTVAELRAYPGRAWVWAVGIPLATATAYLRMAADKHYLTDVLVGAAVGSAFGAGIPLLLHPREHATVTAMEIRLVPAGSGAALSGTF